MSKKDEKGKVVVDLSNVDWRLLRSQKIHLLDQISDEDDAMGIVYLLDEIQDQAAKQLGAKEVFGEEEDANV